MLAVLKFSGEQILSSFPPDIVYNLPVFCNIVHVNLKE